MVTQIRSNKSVWVGEKVPWTIYCNKVEEEEEDDVDQEDISNVS